MDTQFAIAFDLNLISVVDYQKIEERSAEVRRLLNGLIESIQSSRESS